MPLYVFICSCGEKIEAIRPVGTDSVSCACGETAERIAIYAPTIGGRERPPVSEREVSLRQFTEASEQLAYEHARAEESAQVPLPAPPLWRAARKRAKKLEQAGITDSLDYRPDYIRD